MHFVSSWLPIVAAIASVLSALIVWGFASGRFVQRQTDEVEDLRREIDKLCKDVETLRERVAGCDGRIADSNKARQVYIDKVNVALGRLGHKHDLMQQRMDIDDKHRDERNERVELRLDEGERRFRELQRQIDALGSGPEYDGTERRRR